MKTKKWLIFYFLFLLFIFILVGIITIFVDPYFHYHKPYTNLFFYELNADTERYVNDGITRLFDYDAVITGTSMTENFHATEFNELFNCHSIKVPYRGASFFETCENLKKGYRDHNIKYVLRSLDENFNIGSNEKTGYLNWPEYLYNESVVDDIKYIVNIDVLKEILKIFPNCLKRKTGIISFDDYANWANDYPYGKEQVLKGRLSYKAPNKIHDFTKEDVQRIQENVQKNILDIANSHPETTFYYFFPPYSIAHWGTRYEEGLLLKKLKERAFLIRILVQYDNIRLFSFSEQKNWILNLDNYIEETHYNAQINSAMLKLMKEDKFRITKDNVEEYIKSEEDFFMNFDYNSIF